MRNPNRLYDFYNILCTYHIERFPDWRFGQFICNLERWLYAKKNVNDLFYIEEDEMLQYIYEFVEEMKL